MTRVAIQCIIIFGPIGFSAKVVVFTEETAAIFWEGFAIVGRSAGGGGGVLPLWPG
jgi:hypothetical protein